MATYVIGDEWLIRARFVFALILDSSWFDLLAR